MWPLQVVTVFVLYLPKSHLCSVLPPLQVLLCLSLILQTLFSLPLSHLISHFRELFHQSHSLQFLKFKILI